MLQSIALWSINIYQKYISPYKGYRCAYGVYYQDGTCSSIIKSHIQKHGVIKAYPMIKDQFRACKVAYLAIQESNNQQGCSTDDENSCVCDSCCFGSKEDEKKKKEDNCSCDPCSGCTPDLSGCDCGSAVPCDVLPCSL